MGERWQFSPTPLPVARYHKLNADHSKIGAVSSSTEHVDDTEAIGSRKLLLSMLDGREISEIDKSETPVELREGDIVILATDGLDALGGDEIADILYRNRESDPQIIANELIAGVRAKKLQRQDNAAIIVANVSRASGVNFRAGFGQKMLK